MTQHIITADLENQTLVRLIEEQCNGIKNIRFSDIPSEADIVFIEENAKSAAYQHKIAISLPKGAIRLGLVIDKLLYALSGREKLIEEESLIIKLRDFEFRPADNQISDKKSDRIIRLTDKERLLLKTLYEAGDEGVLKKDLIKMIWDYAEDVESHTLETHLYRLRQKLEVFNCEDIVVVQNGLYKLNLV
jgi:two-component SAPR family response regulator